MAADLSQVSMLARREIEVRMVAPFIGVLIRELGRDRAFNIVQEIIETFARESGLQLAQAVGGTSIADFEEGLKYWMKDNALEIEVLEKTKTTLAFNAVRCRYAEMYKDLGLQDLGKYLSCSRDFAFIEGFNPIIRLTRAHTIMEGAKHCDFRYELMESQDKK